MTDTVTKTRRSEIMSSIRGKNTKPEKIVRSFLHSKGLRFRLHPAKLPGKPDIVFPKYKAAIFVHGCFWHGHAHCKLARIPKSNVKFWTEKIRGNARRDKVKKTALKKLGWRVITIWECNLSGKALNRIFTAIKSE